MFLIGYHFLTPPGRPCYFFVVVLVTGQPTENNFKLIMLAFLFDLSFWFSSFSVLLSHNLLNGELIQTNQSVKPGSNTLTFSCSSFQQAVHMNR